MTLLNKALAAKLKRPRSSSSDEEIELAIAWLRGEIGITQVQVALQSKHSGSIAYLFLARSLRDAYAKGKLQITGVKP